MYIGAALLAVLALSCFKGKDMRQSDEIPTITGFELQKYLGKWYEIARMDFRFEKNLIKCTAEYSMRDDGKVRVVNRGYDTIQDKWKQSTGKAKLVSGPDKGRLKVSFFGPFYSAYNIVMLDSEYRHALVLGKSPRYMWILSREKTISDPVKQQYLEKARSLGVAVDELVWTPQ